MPESLTKKLPLKIVKHGVPRAVTTWFQINASFFMKTRTKITWHTLYITCTLVNIVCWFVYQDKSEKMIIC